MKVLGILLLVAAFGQEILGKSYKNHLAVVFTIENEEQLKEAQSLEGQPGVRQQQSHKILSLVT
jgi:hypothetical protein